MTAAAAPVVYDAKLDQHLFARAAQYTLDPLGYAFWAWDWGHGPLERKALRKWQVRFLDRLGQDLRRTAGQKHQVLRYACATGHGVGKSALISILSNWAMSTMVDAKGIVTANTDIQLRTKTWAEMQKWHAMSITRDWFKLTNTTLQGGGNHEHSWRIDKVPWSANTSEAFQGLHNEGKRIIIFFDEASAIAETIFKATEGALTDEYTQIIWICFGNPTRNKGEFFNCFHRYRERWNTLHLDAREIEGTNKVQIQEWIDDYGIDSDFVRVRVLGKFPRAGDMQFISSDIVQLAQTREVNCLLTDPFIMGVDVAYGGMAKSVICFRKGFDARTHRPIKIRGRHTKDLVRLQGLIGHYWEHFKADAIFIDGTGIGAGVYRNLKAQGLPIFEVLNAAESPDPMYGNMRAYCWGMMKDWLVQGGAIRADNIDLEGDLVAPEYRYRLKDNAILLTPKDRMIDELGLPPPDDGDALANTFSAPVAQRMQAGGLGLQTTHQPPTEWDLLSGPDPQKRFPTGKGWN